MREFITAAEEASGEQDDMIEVPLDGIIYRAHRPTDGQFAFLMASTGKHSRTEDQIAGQVNFFISLFDDDDAQALAARLLDRKDPFGIDMMGQIMGGLAEEWAGRPTVPSSVSTASPKTGGRKSTPRTPKSISSGSPSIAS